MASPKPDVSDLDVGRLWLAGLTAWRAGKTFRWLAGITVRGHRIRIGVFKTEDAAARAYDVEAKRHFGEFARTNVDLGLLPPL